MSDFTALAIDWLPLVLSLLLTAIATFRPHVVLWLIASGGFALFGATSTTSSPEVQLLSWCLSVYASWNAWSTSR